MEVRRELTLDSALSKSRFEKYKKYFYSLTNRSFKNIHPRQSSQEDRLHKTVNNSQICTNYKTILNKSKYGIFKEY